MSSERAVMVDVYCGFEGCGFACSKGWHRNGVCEHCESHREPTAPHAYEPKWMKMYEITLPTEVV